MHQSSLNSHKNKGHSPFFFPPIMRSSVGQCRNIRFRQLSASHVIITSVDSMRYEYTNMFYVLSYVLFCLSNYVLYFFGYKTFFSPLQNNSKGLDPSCNTDLDLWDCLGRVILVLYQNFIGMI